jgi:hypothetical protein
MIEGPGLRLAFAASLQSHHAAARDAANAKRKRGGWTSRPVGTTGGFFRL